MSKVKIASPRSELMVLRAMCHPNKKISGQVLGSVDSSYFASEEAREIMSSISRQMAETGAPPLFKLVIRDPDLSVEARTYFRDSEATLQTPEDAVKAVKILNRYRQNRIAHELMMTWDKAFQSGKIDTDAMLAHAAAQISMAMSAKSSSNQFVHMGLNSNSMGEIKDLLWGDKSENVIPTGISKLDEVIGGFLRGSLVTVGATSGGGKSLMACQLAINMAYAGYKVVIIPLEMSKEEMEARIIANLTGIDVTRILTGKLTEAEKTKCFERYRKWSLRVKKRGGRLTIFRPKEDMTLEELFASVAAFGADVRIVDYISLLKGVDGDDQWQKLGAAARLGKVNAEATGSINVLLCQIGEDGKVRYARSISEHSSNSLVWSVKKEEREKPVARVRVEQPKCRNSKSFPFEIGLEWACMRVVEVESIADTSGSEGSDKEPLANLAEI